MKMKHKTTFLDRANKVVWAIVWFNFNLIIVLMAVYIIAVVIRFMIIPALQYRP